MTKSDLTDQEQALLKRAIAIALGIEPDTRQDFVQLVPDPGHALQMARDDEEGFRRYVAANDTMGFQNS
jgi:hypothetical protein